MEKSWSVSMTSALVILNLFIGPLEHITPYQPLHPSIFSVHEIKKRIIQHLRYKTRLANQ